MITAFSPFGTHRPTHSSLSVIINLYLSLDKLWNPIYISQTYYSCCFASNVKMWSDSNPLMIENSRILNFIVQNDNIYPRFHFSVNTNSDLNESNFMRSDYASEMKLTLEDSFLAKTHYTVDYKIQKLKPEN